MTDTDICYSNRKDINIDLVFSLQVMSKIFVDISGLQANFYLLYTFRTTSSIIYQYYTHLLTNMSPKNSYMSCFSLLPYLTKGLIFRIDIKYILINKINSLFSANIPLNLYRFIDHIGWKNTINILLFIWCPLHPWPNVETIGISIKYVQKFMSKFMQKLK